MKLCEKEIRRHLSGKQELAFELFDTLPSTNSYLKELAEKGERQGLVAVADTQSAGRGRMGRAFACPSGSGIYMSVLLRPNSALADATLITACAAVAVSEAIENVTGIKVGIKWVNDLYYGGKKVCGILAEGAYSAERSAYEHVILGIGINLLDTFGGTELEGIAGGLYTDLEKNAINDLRHTLIAEVLDCFFGYYDLGLSDIRAELLRKYEERLFIVGKAVDVISYTGEKQATVLGLNGDFSLSVSYSDGSVGTLNSGEVRLRVL
jgi:BirA family biotin operon repressor/biotin-[acetyl-CoA-carboxylase] ligase